MLTSGCSFLPVDEEKYIGCYSYNNTIFVELGSKSVKFHGKSYPFEYFAKDRI